MDPQHLAIAHELNILDLPIGVYVVAPDGRFLACNRSVRAMFNLPLEGDIRASISQFYADSKARNELLRKATEAEARGAYLEKEIIPFRVGDRKLYLEDYCKPLRDPATRDIIGYVGCLVDVTAEQEAEKRESKLQKRVEELTFDIGRILHANTGTLLMAQQTLDGVAEALGQHTIKELIAAPLEERDEQLLKEAALLANAIDKLAQATDPERRRHALSEAKWDALTGKIAPLRQARDVVPGMEMRAPALRTTAHQITAICQDMSPGVLARELVREVMRAAAQLESSACLVDVLMTRTAIIQMDSTLRSLRDFITADVRTYEPKKRLSVKQLTDQAITQIAEFARSSRVDIVRRDRDFDTSVEGVERDLVRALSNLLHNAIKYSWRRDRAKAPWLTIRTYAREGMACVEFENWGVPIAQDEIEQGLIFQLGYRGKWSKDRGRLGTGIGLTDARRTAQTHYGNLRVASRPSNPGWVRPEDPNYYNQPFVTTVTFCIPEALKK
jgi:signal transduction histidine kinase